MITDRTEGIGASEVHKIYDDPMGLYLSKVGILEDPEENEAMWLGTNFEPVMDKRYFKETGLMPMQVEPIIHPTEPWRRCSPDRLVKKNGAKILLEYKTTGYHNDWGSPGSDEVPFRVATQVQWQLSLMPDVNQAEIPVYFFAPRREFAIYRMERNEEVIDNLVEAARDFWENHVIPQIPPPIDASEGSKKLLNFLYPQDKSDLLVSSDGLNILAERLKDQELKRDQIINQLTLLQNQFKEIIGDHVGVQTSLGKITWKKTKDREQVDWKGVADYIATMTDYPLERVTKKFTNIIPGSRVFRSLWKKEE